MTGCTLPPYTGPTVTLITALTPVPSTLHSVGRLWARVIWPGPSLPLLEFGWLGVLLPLHPYLWPCSWGLPGALKEALPCLVQVRVAINLAICWLSCPIPSPGQLSPWPHLTQYTGSLHFCSLPSGQQPSAANRRYQGYCTSTGQSHGYVCGPHGRGNPWGAVVPPGQTSFQGTEADLI